MGKIVCQTRKLGLDKDCGYIRKVGEVDLKKNAIFGTIKSMKTLYDVQQILKRFAIFVHMGNRLYDIEVMQIELNRLYQAGVIERDEYLRAELVLRREHRLEEEYQNKQER